MGFLVLVALFSTSFLFFAVQNNMKADMLPVPSILPLILQNLTNKECQVSNTDGICLYGSALNSLNEKVLCSGPMEQLNCNNSIRSIMASNCNGRLGNVMFAYATLFYFHYKMGFNGIIDEWMAFNMNTVFKDTYAIKEGNMWQKMAEGWQDFVGAGVARQDEYGEHYYTPLFEDPDKYMYNMILGVGAYPSPFYLFQEIWPELKKQFQFKDLILESARAALEQSTQPARGNYSGLGLEFIYVAVHHRREDYIGHSRLQDFFENDRIQVDFIENCMNEYRKKFDRDNIKTIFVMQSGGDDEWMRTYFEHHPDVGFPGTFAPIEETGPEFVSREGHKWSLPTMPGRDMAIFSLCQHVIRTYGTYGIWGGFWAGGTVMSPYTGRLLIDEHILYMLNKDNPDWIMVDINPLLKKYLTPDSPTPPPQGPPKTGVYIEPSFA